jgi:Amt family ammonium transporter
MAQEPAAPAATEPAAAAPADAATPMPEAAAPAADAPPAAPAVPNWYKGADDKGEVKPDPIGALSGAGATPAADGKGDVLESVKPEEMNAFLYNRIAHNWFSINFVWTLITGFLVMFMQAGFACVETGLCRAKNSSHTFAMNLMIYPLGCFGFWLYGFAIGWGNWYNAAVPGAWVSTLGTTTAVLTGGWGLELDAATGLYKWPLIGTKGFCLSGVDDVGVMALFFFMMVFMDTTATIPTGTMAERWAWKNFCIYGLWIAFPYCIYANWVWGGGWLSKLGLNSAFGHGAVDFAGSGVVHAMGGVIALVGGVMIGPRIGKYVNGKPRAIPGHNVPMVCVGTFILAFGWFGFNPGSTLAGTDLRIAAVVVNTMLAGTTASLACMFWLMFIRGLKPDPTMMCNGMLAGLVAITAPCAFVNSTGAAIIGAIAGVLVVESVFFFDKIGVDDVVGAVSVHGINGLFGVISVGIFATGEYGIGWNGVDRYSALATDAEKEAWTKTVGYAYDGVRGILYGDSSQLIAQLISAATVVVAGTVISFILFSITNMITPMRVSREVELEGLDGPEMGALGYPDFELKGGALDA